MLITHDTEFLHTDSEENPAARVCTKVCRLVRPVLLFFNAVCLCRDGTPERLVKSIERTGHRLRRISCGYPDWYTLDRLFIVYVVIDRRYGILIPELDGSRLTCRPQSIRE